MIPPSKAKYNGFICIFGYKLLTFVAMGGVRNFAPTSFVAELTISWSVMRRRDGQFSYN
jgi:hypothetical protein